MHVRIALCAVFLVAGQCGASTPRAEPARSAKQLGRDRILLPDQVNYTKGSYLAYASPWCAMKDKSLVIGRDLANSIELRPSSFPAGTRIAVSAPRTHTNRHGCGVYGYHFVSFGNYDNGRVQKPVPSARIGNIARLRIAFDVDSSGSDGDYNILNEFYLTARPGTAEKVAEVGYFLHASDDTMRFAKRGRAYGSYVDPSGHGWAVYKADAFVMLLPADGRDLSSGTLDVRHLLRDLVRRGAVPANGWFNGVALGLEPVGGKAQLAIKRWSVDYQPTR